MTFNTFDYWFNNTEVQGGADYKSRYIFDNLVKTLEIPTQGFCMQIGVHTGYTYNLMKEYFGANRVKGIDIFNYNNDPTVIECDVAQLDFKMPIAYAENDVGNVNIDPTPRLLAFKWAVANLVPNGKVITTSNVANEKFGERVEDICVEHGCTWQRLDAYNQTPWGKFINEKTKWNLISLMLVTKED